MEADIRKLFYIETGLGVICFIATLIYFPSTPPKPPSISAGQKRKQHFYSDIKRLLTKWDIWALTLAFALIIGVHSAWLSAINVLWTPIGISQQKAGFIVFLSTLGLSLIHI